MEENVNLFHELYNGHYMDRSMNMDQNHKFLYTMLYLHDILRKKRLAKFHGEMKKMLTFFMNIIMCISWTGQ